MISLSVNNISYKYDVKWVIRNFSYEFRDNNVYLLTAPNGRGKTTLLRILAGELTPLSGTIALRLGNVSVPYSLFYKNISFLTPSMDIPESLRVLEILRYYYRVGYLSISIEQFLEVLNLGVYSGYMIKELSSGTQQRLLLGLTTFTNKSVLIFDEPTSNLDDNNTRLFFSLLRKVSTEKVVIVASNLVREGILLRELFGDFIGISL